MKLSIIIPTFNSANVLRRALDSVVNQTFKDWEALIMDGDSKDCTITIAQSYDDNRIKVFSEPDDGIYDAMNKGIRKSQGEWLYFLGSDDWLVNDLVLEKMFSQEMNSYEIVYGDVEAPQLSIDHHGEWCLDCIESNRCHQSIFYKRIFFEKKGRYSLKYRYLADFDMNLRWFLDKTIQKKYYPICIAHYSENGASQQNVDNIFSKDFSKLILSYGYKSFDINQKISYTKKIINQCNGCCVRLRWQILLAYLRLKRYLARKIDNLYNQVNCKKYSTWVESLKKDTSNFIPYTNSPYRRRPEDPKIFAYYLPQFYSIKENDNAYGKGFTEWVNVATATPQFVGHYQPKIPYDLGFYNLTMPGVMERQVQIAKDYGIYGFCFYYYWFSGKKVLERPLDYFLNSEIDFSFHLCWANENWSKLWDGGNKEVILEQQYSEMDPDLFFGDILPYISDPRYEKIDNKPLLIIYRPQVMGYEYLLAFLYRLNVLAQDNGFDGFFFMSSNTDGFNDPILYGFEGIVEFPPHGVFDKSVDIRKKRLCMNSKFVIKDISKYIGECQYIGNENYLVFKGVFPSWDNTPRKLFSNGVCFQMSDKDFERWFDGVIDWTRTNNPDDKQYVYINAWNEWAEGAVLEPTTRLGYNYLDIIKRVIERKMPNWQSSN